MRDIIKYRYKKVPKDIINVSRLKRDLIIKNKAEAKKAGMGYEPDKNKLFLEAFMELEENIIVPREYKPLYLEEVEEYDDTVATPKVYINDVIDLRPNQIDAFQAMKDRGPNGILNLAPGKGKTVLALKYLGYFGGPALVIVHTNELLRQWENRIREFTTEDTIGRIQGPNCDYEYPITVGMLRSLAIKNYPDAIGDYFRIVIFDEVDVMNAMLMSKVLWLFGGKRLALTATVERQDGFEKLTYWHCGDILYKDLSQDLKPMVYFYDPGVRVNIGKFKQWNGNINTQKLKTYLAENVERNEVILDLMKKALKDNKKRKLLILGDRINQLEYLDNCFDHPSTGLVIGEKSSDERQEALKRQVVIGTSQLARRGLDKASMDTLFFLNTFSDPNNLTQGIGRIQRIANKEVPIVIVIEDRSVEFFYRMGMNMRRHLRKLNIPYKNAGVK